VVLDVMPLAFVEDVDAAVVAPLLEQVDDAGERRHSARALVRWIHDHVDQPGLVGARNGRSLPRFRVDRHRSIDVRTAHLDVERARADEQAVRAGLQDAASEHRQPVTTCHSHELTPFAGQILYLTHPSAFHTYWVRR
jgi:hypothetical protein